jgi:CheY-like chemotaxis protein
MHHILVVDDNPLDRELARSILERRADFHVEFASTGVEALEHLEGAIPLAIVTDLQMPEMDGLTLVRAVRRRFPTIPVVLMTAHGSESLAVEALVAGAADYVPKQCLARDLPRVVDGVLSAPLGDRRREQILPYWRYTELRYVLPSEVELVPPLVDQLLRLSVNSGLVEQTEQLRLAKCLTESLRNAIIHGSRRSLGASDQLTSSSPDKTHVTVIAVLAPQEGRFVIRDQGPGFEHSTIGDPRISPTLLTDDSGKGLALIRLFMDDVQFNALGNEITLVKRRATEHVPASF